MVTSAPTNIGGHDAERRLGQPVRRERRHSGRCRRASATRSFVRDFNTTATTFITNDTTRSRPAARTRCRSAGWQCNFDNNVNSKIDVMNAYAAAYTAADGDEILYFALERNANTGTANVGFWFLQDPVGCASTGGAVTFTGEHRTATCSSCPSSPTAAPSAHQRLPLGRRRRPRLAEPDPGRQMAPTAGASLSARTTRPADGEHGNDHDAVAHREQDRRRRPHPPARRSSSRAA